MPFQVSGQFVATKSSGLLHVAGCGGAFVLAVGAAFVAMMSSAADPSEHVASRSRKPAIALSQAVRTIAPSYRPNITIAPAVERPPRGRYQMADYPTGRAAMQVAGCDGVFALLAGLSAGSLSSYRGFGATHFCGPKCYETAEADLEPDLPRATHDARARFSIARTAPSQCSA